jgi:hypothetical protein
MGPRKRSESLGSSGCFRLCNKIMTRSTGNFESQSCNVPQSFGCAANPASCSVSRSPNSPVSHFLPAPGRKATYVLDVSSQSSRCVWSVSRAVVDGYASVFSYVGLPAYDRSVAAQTATVICWVCVRSLADNRSAWTLEELVCRPLSASYYTKMVANTTVMARASGSCFPSGSGFVKQHRGD